MKKAYQGRKNTLSGAHFVARGREATSRGKERVGGQDFVQLSGGYSHRDGAHDRRAAAPILGSRLSKVGKRRLLKDAARYRQRIGTSDEEKDRRKGFVGA